MPENIRDFIAFHNNNISDSNLAVTLESLTLFANFKNIALEELSIEKHRMPFINWKTSLVNSSL